MSVPQRVVDNVELQYLCALFPSVESDFAAQTLAISQSLEQAIGWLNGELYPDVNSVRFLRAFDRSKDEQATLALQAVQDLAETLALEKPTRPLQDSLYWAEYEETVTRVVVDTTCVDLENGPKVRDSGSVIATYRPRVSMSSHEPDSDVQPSLNDNGLIFSWLPESTDGSLAYVPPLPPTTSSNEMDEGGPAGSDLLAEFADLFTEPHVGSNVLKISREVSNETRYPNLQQRISTSLPFILSVVEAALRDLKAPPMKGVAVTVPVLGNLIFSTTNGATVRLARLPANKAMVTILPEAAGFKIKIKGIALQMEPIGYYYHERGKTEEVRGTAHISTSDAKLSLTLDVLLAHSGRTYIDVKRCNSNIGAFVLRAEATNHGWLVNTLCTVLRPVLTRVISSNLNKSLTRKFCLD